MLQSEIRMCAGIGKSQNEDVVLNHVDKHPVILDVAITKTDKVSNESMVVKSRRKRFSIGKHADYGGYLLDVLSPLKHLLETFFVAGCYSDCVFHESMNSSSLSGSVHVGAFGSLATSSASLNAASNRSRFVSRESVKGILPVARHFLKKQVMAVVIFMPISSKNSSASDLRASSMRIVSEVVIAKSLSFVKTERIVSKNECKCNAA